MCMELHREGRNLLLYTGGCGQIDTLWIYPMWQLRQFSVL